MLETKYESFYGSPPERKFAPYALKAAELQRLLGHKKRYGNRHYRINYRISCGRDDRI